MKSYRSAVCACGAAILSAGVWAAYCLGHSFLSLLMAIGAILLSAAGGILAVRQIRTLEKKSAGAQASAKQLRAELEDARSSLRERYIKGILQGELPERDRLDAFLERYDIHFCSDTFSVMSIISVDESGFFSDDPDYRPSFHEMVRFRETVTDTFEQALSQLAEFYLVLADSNLRAILPLRNPPQLEGAGADEAARSCTLELEAAVSRALELLEEKYGIVFLATISSPFRGIYALNKAYVESLGLAERGFGGRKVLSIYSIEADAAERATLNRRVDCERRFYNCVVTADFRHAGEAISERMKLDAEDPLIPFQKLKSDALQRLDFMISTMGVTWHAASGSGGMLRSILAAQKSEDMEELEKRLRHFCEQFQRLWAESTQEVPDRAGQIMAYIQRNYKNPNLNATMLCDQFGISQAYLSRMFKQRTGMGVLEYIHKTRVAEAKKLLNTNLTIGEIADRVGYFSRRTLTQAFKRYEGITPDSWRKNLTEEPTLYQE